MITEEGGRGAALAGGGVPGLGVGDGDVVHGIQII